MHGYGLICQVINHCVVFQGYHGPPSSEQGRAPTWHSFNKEGLSDSRRGARSEPTRVRPTYPFPSLHLMQVSFKPSQSII